MARWCALLMLVLLVWQPVWHASVPVPPRCLLAIDNSLSTQNNKASDVRRDVDLLQSLLAAKTTYLSDFLAEHIASGIGSPLGDWLAALAAQEHSIDVVCLVSDGITTHGTQIAETANLFRVPVFCVATGSDVVSTHIPVLLDETVTPIKCLFIERSPRPEYRFLRDVLQQLDECSLQTVLLDADEQTNLTADQIDEIDLVIVGDVDTAKLPARLFDRPVLFISGEYSNKHTASQPGTPLTFTWSDDPVLPLQRRNTKSTVRWGVPLQLDNAMPLRVLASVGEKPLIAIDETLRRCWCGTDELYRLADDAIDPNNREMWRRLITLLARTPDGESFVRVRYEDFDEIQIESLRRHRDTTALKSLATTTGGEFFTSGSPHKVATAIREHLANTTRYEMRAIPLIPRWLLFTIAIACLLWAWTKK